MHLFERGFDDLSAPTLYAILRLRNEVFVVEQQCPFRDLDGRDREPETRHLWLGPATDDPRAYLRTVEEPDGSVRIGRVCTAVSARGLGLGRQLMASAVSRVGTRPAVLDAQSHLVDFYAAFGFVASGPDYVEDGIRHTPMHRKPSDGGSQWTG